MTLETAKRMVEEGHSNKEAEAIVRGGMTICENKTDGSRKYVWVKVKPTMTDAESSIDLAMETYRKRKIRKPRRIVEDSEPQDDKTSPESNSLHPQKEVEAPSPRPSFYERLKKRAKEIWEDIDSVVIE